MFCIQSPLYFCPVGGDIAPTGWFSNRQSNRQRFLQYEHLLTDHLSVYGKSTYSGFIQIPVWRGFLDNLLEYFGASERRKSRIRRTSGPNFFFITSKSWNFCYFCYVLSANLSVINIWWRLIKLLTKTPGLQMCIRRRSSIQRLNIFFWLIQWVRVFLLSFWQTICKYWLYPAIWNVPVLFIYCKQLGACQLAQL